MNIDVFSFFSGAGFLDLGFEDEDFNIVFVNEFNEDFMDVYKFARSYNGRKQPKYGYFQGDINELLRGTLRKELTKNVNISKKNGLVGFIGGPPCPDFSAAGKNKGIEGENGKLTMSYKRIILDQEPDFFLFENVKGLWKTKKHRCSYEKLKKSFKRKGYVLVDNLVNCLDYGVPQDRERIILIGFKYKLFAETRREATRLLKKTFDWKQKKKYSKEHRDACDWPCNEPFVEDSIRPQPKNIIPELTVEYWFRKNNVYRHYNSDDYFTPHSDRFTTVDEGDVGKKSFKRLHRWRYSPTAAYGNNEVHVHPYKARRLSVAEALAIQSLPASFVIKKDISKSDMFKTICNGVPYLLSRTIAKSIKDTIDCYCEGGEDGIHS